MFTARTGPGQPQPQGDSGQARSCHYHRDDGYLRASLPRRRGPRPRGHRRDPRGGSDGTGTEPGNVMTIPSQVSDIKVGESACRPGSVRPLARGGGHPSGTAVAGSLVRSTREHRAGRPRSLAQGATGSPLDLAPGGVYRAAAVTCGAGGLLHHRFTLTPAHAGAVCFLWHCPAGHPGSALPTTLPCGARTFLTGLAPGATARPTHPYSGYAGCHQARVANRAGAGERRQRFDRRRHRGIRHRPGRTLLSEHPSRSRCRTGSEFRPSIRCLPLLADALNPSFMRLWCFAVCGGVARARSQIRAAVSSRLP